jgi:hypothetical protein
MNVGFTFPDKIDSAPETACIYLGSERHLIAKLRAKELRYHNFSQYISMLIDCGIEIDADLIKRIRNSSIQRRMTVAQFIKSVLEVSVQ